MAVYYAGPYGPHLIQRSAEEIEHDIKRTMLYDTWVDANQINVDVNNGMVTLTGTVDSATEKRAVGDDAWGTPG